MLSFSLAHPWSIATSTSMARVRTDGLDIDVKNAMILLGYIVRGAQEKLSWLNGSLSKYKFMDDEAKVKARSWGFRSARNMLKDVFHSQGRHAQKLFEDAGRDYSDMHVQYRNQEAKKGLTLMLEPEANATHHTIDPTHMWDAYYQHISATQDADETDATARETLAKFFLEDITLEDLQETGSQIIRNSPHALSVDSLISALLILVLPRPELAAHFKKVGLQPDRTWWRNTITWQLNDFHAKQMQSGGGKYA
jgi:hypothetical protein